MPTNMLTDVEINETSMSIYALFIIFIYILYIYIYIYICMISQYIFVFFVRVLIYVKARRFTVIVKFYTLDI